MTKLQPDTWVHWIGTQCTVLEAEAATQGDSLGGQRTELQARFIRLKAETIAALPLPRLVRCRMLQKLACRHWPQHPDLDCTQ